MWWCVINIFLYIEMIFLLTVIVKESFDFCEVNPSPLFWPWNQQCKDALAVPCSMCYTKAHAGLLSRTHHAGNIMGVSVLIQLSFWLLVTPLMFLQFLHLVLPSFYFSLPSALFFFFFLNVVFRLKPGLAWMLGQHCTYSPISPAHRVSFSCLLLVILTHPGTKCSS